MADTCATCSYFSGTECHRHAPDATTAIDDSTPMFWSLVSSTDWCGEWASGVQTIQTCATCYNYHGGLCRAWAPNLLRAKVTGKKKPWPAVQSADWCGEWTGSGPSYSAGLVQRPITAVDGDMELTIVPPGYAVTNIYYNETAGHDVNIKVGTTAGAYDINGFNVLANSFVRSFAGAPFPRVFSVSSPQSIYISSSNWNSASLDIMVILERAAP